MGQGFIIISKQIRRISSQYLQQHASECVCSLHANRCSSGRYTYKKSKPSKDCTYGVWKSGRNLMYWNLYIVVWVRRLYLEAIFSHSLVGSRTPQNIILWLLLRVILKNLTSYTYLSNPKKTKIVIALVCVLLNPTPKKHKFLIALVGKFIEPNQTSH